MDLGGWISVGINVVVVAVLLAGRKLIELEVEKRVQHKFDTKLEATKSDLRTRETEISALRDMVLRGTAQRQALVEQRRIEAVEKIWAATIALAPLVMTSASMARINFDEAAKRTPGNANLRQFFNVISAPTLLEKVANAQPTPPIQEQPFISPLAWAYFSAYQNIVMDAYLQARALADGVEDAGKLLKRDHGRELLKATLPHQAKFIESNDPSVYHHLLNELQQSLLTELRKMLDGEETDRAAIDKVTVINNVLNKIETERAEQKMPASPP